MRRQTSRGFTLIELLVVVFIIGILLGAAMLSLGVASQDNKLSEEADRLVYLFALLRDRALTENREYGFSIDLQGRYLWWQRHQEKQVWRKLSDKPWQSYKLGDNARLELRLMNRRLKKDEYSMSQPIIVLFSDRQVTPFTLSLSDEEGEKSVLNTDGYNDVFTIQ
ncbi:type II secretion system minor pseudopilin GspH [Endozoicomonas ascidiicola]|uniref:type II secretion system minor pseudopilin GspH n=1 Tax=Endozoicomonas ascidiicola TaxID=1698521 RepID=UPI0008332185|nr:type II secretion system minor pseudopilin GspH [Endozoicomonas ascidiicola]